MSVILETSVGDLTVDLYTEDRPKCSKNFIKLCKVKYYNFSLFHSVQRNLVAQTGDPTATGKGGESIYGMLYGEQARFFDMELAPRIKHKKRGLLSMVNNGSGMHGSQFFITLGEDLDYLDGVHTVFGEVAEGFDVLDKLNDAYCDEKHRPYRDIRIFHTVILDDPFDDPVGLDAPDKSPGPTKEMLESDRIGVDEEVDDTKGMTEHEIKELQAEREAKANAQLLEMIGDIPEADVRPPENVLFVCQLNPVTTDEDLEMIFSRFGPIRSCEVIRDQKSGESLQYAFIEFEEEEHCENAYFKMDNVLIDDRRIHVDFSQSVSKLKYMKRGRKGDEEKDDKPSYVLKDQQRKDSRYDLVFEHDQIEDSNAEKKMKKKNKHRHRSRSQSREDSDSQTLKKKKSKKRKHSPSGSRSPADRSRSLSSSPDHKHRGKGHREEREDKSRRHKARARHSSSSSDDHRKRHRGREGDRQRGGGTDNRRQDRRDRERRR